MYTPAPSIESRPKRLGMNEGCRPSPELTRRASLRLLAGAAAASGAAATWSSAAQTAASFPQWVETFRSRATARGVSDATYTRVMRGLKPDTSVYALDREQPEFTEKLWQYL